jgi:hypothetical protein
VAASCIVVPVPEVERAVDLPRREHTRDGADGMPAHITLIYPFVDDAELTPAHVDEVGKVVGRFPRFSFALTSVERFTHAAGAHVWLAPTPAAPFVELVHALERAFPAYPSFAGEYDSVIPHLTVASRTSEEAIATVEAELADALPIEAYATTVYVMVNDAGQWRTRSEHGLGSRGAVRYSATMNEDDLRRLREVGAEEQVSAGQTLIERGQYGAGLFVILEGSVLVEAREGTRELGEGSIVGERALLSEDGLRTARVRAASDLRVLAVDRAHFERLCADDPAFAERVADASR